MSSNIHIRPFDELRGIMIFLGLLFLCFPSFAQDCSVLKIENEQLKRELLILKAENAELVMDVQALSTSNKFLRGENDHLIDEIVPMRYWNKKYEKMKPRLTALENEAKKLREDSIRYSQAIRQLKGSPQTVSDQQSTVIVNPDNYIANNINITRVNKSNIDIHFYLDLLNARTPSSKDEVLIKAKVFRKVKGNWEQVVYGEKGSESYDKYYKLKFCKVADNNTIRYHSINNFDNKGETSAYQLEFYHKENMIATYGF